MDDKLTIDSQTDPASGVCTIKLTGPLVLSNMFAFQTRLREEKNANVILDLSAVPYVDSAGIGVLVNGLVSCKNHGRTLVLAGVVERVMTVLKVTKVDTLFQFADSRASA
jgi:anti-sigma B factor antagonist